ncbi:hypothetical protein DB30_06928 [Enhygromyxa salina]|uniref:Peptidase S1 domain-containing protein n=1 Tax=Enhygromyxa salina TaxID=215803 RepID=A0A0C2CT35_9BACT|nr:hypothetical protein [Enhygromyxa salina]KIG14326.1 hypothetical protein DB30_06928 [Enhygromyxa salina]
MQTQRACELAVGLLCGEPERAAATLGVTPSHRSLVRLVAAAQPWLRSRKVQGVGVGRRVRQGVRFADQPVVTILVDTKVAARGLAHPIPQRLVLPGHGEVELDVRPVGQLFAQARYRVSRPALCGSSIGHAAGGIGTLGCLVRPRRASEAVYLLSAAHVIAPHGRASLGDPIYQPAVAEYRPPRSPIAKLSGHTALSRGRSHANSVDAAIAELTEPHSVVRDLLAFGLAPKDTAQVADGDRVDKVGARTHRTSGWVTEITANVFLRYPNMGGALVGFRDQIVCTSMSRAGDSGALVVDAQCRAIGLLIGGSDTATIVTPIAAVLREFGVRLA